MSLTKTFAILGAALFLSACEDVATIGGGIGASGAPTSSARVNSALVPDAGLVGKLDAASINGAVVTYAYFTDVIGDGRVLVGADVYCGGPGQAAINLVKFERAGRAYHMMAITCR